jgi:hypothetical protein
LSFGPMVVVKTGLTLWRFIADRAFDDSRFGFTLGTQDSGIRSSSATALRFERGCLRNICMGLRKSFDFALGVI